MCYKIGVDIGGTKISVAVLDMSGAKIYTRRVATPKEDYARFLRTVENLVVGAKGALAQGVECSIGFGIPGALDDNDGRVKNANSQFLIGRPLKNDLAALLGNPVAIANDANCFVASEAQDGAAAGCMVVFGVILGTGVGGGLALGGVPWRGANALAGEWGHTPFAFHDTSACGHACYCGKTDCVETILAGPALSRDYHALTGNHLSATDIIARAVDGDANAARVGDGFYENLAKALGSIISIVDPEAIVLGGGLSQVDDIYHQVPARWHKYIFHASPTPLTVQTRLLKSKWGDDSGVRGAAWLGALSGACW